MKKDLRNPTGAFETALPSLPALSAVASAWCSSRRWSVAVVIVLPTWWPSAEGNGHRTVTVSEITETNFENKAII